MVRPLRQSSYCVYQRFTSLSNCALTRGCAVRLLHRPGLELLAPTATKGLEARGYRRSVCIFPTCPNIQKAIGRVMRNMQKNQEAYSQRDVAHQPTSAK